ncbi:methyltransferase [Gemmatimonadetes bacterium T265]|nr:methyltransferase [Gemmatimonadetes bacterium T265]
MPHPSADDIIALYDRTADAWAAVRGRDAVIEGAWLDRFVAALPAPSPAAGRERATVLDLGCGTGYPVAHALLARGLRVTGLDAAPRQIAHARAATPPEHRAAAEWVVADMRVPGAALAGRRFEGVLAWHSSFHLTPDDQRAMFPVYAAHAVPGAVLMFTSGPEPGEVIAAWEGAPLYHASLEDEEYRALLAAHGFALVSHVRRDRACGDASVWLARYAGG